jgi:hypothetical protein
MPSYKQPHDNMVLCHTSDQNNGSEDDRKTVNAKATRKQT